MKYEPPKEKPYTKNCPFCGGSASIHGFQVLIKYYVRCSGCGVMTGEFGTVEEAVSIWNRRTSIRINEEDIDICGFCGESGADKIPHPIRWPGEQAPGTQLVHATCEDEECRRAHSLLSDKQRRDFLETL